MNQDYEWTHEERDQIYSTLSPAQKPFLDKQLRRERPKVFVQKMGADESSQHSGVSQLISTTSRTCKQGKS